MKNNQNIGKILVVYLVALLLLKVDSLLLGGSPRLSIKGLACYLVPVLVMGIFYWIEKRKNTIPCKQDKIDFSKIKGSIYIVIAGGIFCALSISQLGKEELANFQLDICIYLLCTCVMTGIFEEVVFRGLIQNMICEIGKNKEKQEEMCVFIASIIFGITHILNLIEQPQFILGTFTQIIYTFCLGMLLGAIYFKTRSLVFVIILHGLFNFLGQFSVVFVVAQQGKVVLEDINIISMLIQLVVMFPCVIIGKRIIKST